MSSSFDGQVALVTGGASGIGRAVTQRLLEGGAQVAITGRNQGSMLETIEHLGAGGRALAVVADAGEPADAERAVNTTLERFGRLDLLVNNAGMLAPSGPLMSLGAPDAERILDVNVVAPLLHVQHAWRGWMREHGGAIVNVSSVLAVTASPNLGWYAVSKAALSNLTMQLALQLAPKVRVNAVAPAIVRTKFARELYEGNEESVTATFPLGRLGEPLDVADAVAWLLSGAASWITGETLVLDGGRSKGLALSRTPR